MRYINIACDYIDCKNSRTTSWNWITANNGLDQLHFCSSDHHNMWMEKNAGNFWDLKGLGSDDVKYGPKTYQTEDTGKQEYVCRLSPYITEDNKQAIIQSLMMQFQGYDINPTIVAPQDSNKFVLTLDSGSLSTRDIKDKIMNNYFIENVSTRLEAKVVKNLHINLNKEAASRPQGPPLECYGCGTTGGYEKFGVPTQCPHCGSLEVHLNLEAYDQHHSNLDMQDIVGENPFSFDDDEWEKKLKESMKNRVSSPNGEGYDAPVDSNLHVETDQDPQYIIDQSNITDPQRVAKIKEALPHHVSPAHNRELIEQEGLKTFGIEHHNWYTDPGANVFMSPTQNDANDWAKQIQSTHDSEVDYPNEFDIYHINTEGIPTQPGMTDIGKEEIISKRPIDPDRITHIKRFNPQHEASANDKENIDRHNGIAAYLKDKYGWDETQFPYISHDNLSDYSSGDIKKNRSLLHGFTSDAWGDECTCPLCSSARNIPSGNCSSDDCDKNYVQELGDRLFLLRPGSNIIKKNVWTYNPDSAKYTCPNCISKQQKIASIRTASWWTVDEIGVIDWKTTPENGLVNHIVGEITTPEDEIRGKVEHVWGDSPSDVTGTHLHALVKLVPNIKENDAKRIIRSNPNWISEVTKEFMDHEYGMNRPPSKTELDRGINFSIKQDIIDDITNYPSSDHWDKEVKKKMPFYKNHKISSSRHWYPEGNFRSHLEEAHDLDPYEFMDIVGDDPDKFKEYELEYEHNHDRKNHDNDWVYNYYHQHPQSKLDEKFPHFHIDLENNFPHLSSIENQTTKRWWESE